MVARVLGILGLVAVGFLLFMLLTSNPFLRLTDIPADGRDLNPLLQDPWSGVSPAHALHGLRWPGRAVRLCHCRTAGRTPGRRMGPLVAPWATVAWMFLTLGIALGSLVGLLRVGLGRLVVLGSGGERILSSPGS